MNIWTQGIDFDTCNFNEDSETFSCKNVIDDVDGLLNRFLQKEERRHKSYKKSKQCWQ
ncbi:MAG: hypothetical protein WCK67_08735 [bacterium]